MFESRSGYWQHLSLRLVRGLDDDGLSFVVDHVRAVNLLDLDRTKISNQGIALLQRLEYVKELRLKEVAGINDECIEDLNRVAGLEFLHIKGDGITIDGLVKLNIPELKELMFWSTESEMLSDKMKLLQKQLPDCSFIVNGKPWRFDP